MRKVHRVTSVSIICRVCIEQADKQKRKAEQEVEIEQEEQMFLNILEQMEEIDHAEQTNLMVQTVQEEPIEHEVVTNEAEQTELAEPATAVEATAATAVKVSTTVKTAAAGAALGISRSSTVRSLRMEI